MKLSSPTQINKGDVVTETLAELNIEISEAEDRDDFEWLSSILAPRMAFLRANKQFEDRIEYIERIRANFLSKLPPTSSPLSSPLTESDSTGSSSPLVCDDDISLLSPPIDTNNAEPFSPLDSTDGTTPSSPLINTGDIEPSSPPIYSSPHIYIEETESSSPPSSSCSIDVPSPPSSPLESTVSATQKGKRITKIIEPIEIYGNRAIVKCIVKLDGKEYHNIRLFVRHEGVWKLLGWANEPY